jgi:hypothetical protein
MKQAFNNWYTAYLESANAASDDVLIAERDLEDACKHPATLSANTANKLESFCSQAIRNLERILLLKAQIYNPAAQGIQHEDLSSRMEQMARMAYDATLDNCSAFYSVYERNKECAKPLFEYAFEIIEPFVENMIDERNKNIKLIPKIFQAAVTNERTKLIADIEEVAVDIVKCKLRRESKRDECFASLVIYFE